MYEINLWSTRISHIYVMHIAYVQYSVPPPCRAGSGFVRNFRILLDPSAKDGLFYILIFIAYFQFQSIRTSHCFRVIREEGLGAPVQSGCRKGAPRHPCPQQPAKRLAAPPLYTAASEKARPDVSVFSGRRKGVPRRPWGGGDGRPRRRLSPVWRPLRLALSASLVKLIRFWIHDKENSCPGCQIGTFCHFK
jgi:hypothetical protein